MNVFFTHFDPVVSARGLADKHITKMLLESSQLLCNAHRFYGETDPAFYRLTHKNHPCSIWARTNSANYQWLFMHFTELANEFTLRYGKEHLSYTKLRYKLAYLPKGIPKSTSISLPPSCMDDKYKIHLNPQNLDEVVENYRNYYNMGKNHLHSWKVPVRKPLWIINKSMEIEYA